MANATVVRVSADAAGYVLELARAGKSAEAFAATNEMTSRRAAAAQAAINESVAAGVSANTKQINNFMQSLTRQADVAGLSRAELLRLQAANLGVAASAEQYIKKIEQATVANRVFADSNVKNAAAMRMVAPQMTDIVTQLAGGQNPMLIMIQQGGQLKDVFGGVGPAVRALGGYVASLISPATLAAGAVAGLAFAMYQGSKESDEFRKSIILTGNYAGITEGQLNSLATTVAERMNTSISAAREVMQGLVSTGRFTGSSLDLLGRTIMRMADVSGQATSEILKDFAAMPDGVAKWAAAHNQSMHFVTVAQLEYIRNLEEQGKKEDAMRFTSQALYEHLGTVAPENLGYLERAWNSLGRAVSAVWERMKAVGRDTTLDDEIRRAESNLRNQENAVRGMGGNPDNVDVIQRIRAEIVALKEKKKAAEEVAGAQGESNRLQTEGQAALDRIQSVSDGLDRQAAKQKAINELTRDYIALFKANPNSPLLKGVTVDVQKNTVSGGEYAKLLAGIETKFQDRASVSAGQNRINAELAAFNGQSKLVEDALRDHLDRIRSLRQMGVITEEEALDREHDVRQDALEKQLAIAQQQQEIAKGKKQLSALVEYEARERSILQDMLQNDQRTAETRDLLRQKEARSLQQFAASLDRMVSTRANAIDAMVAGVGLGDRARDELERINQVLREIDDRRYDLTRSRAEGRISEDVFQQQLAELERFGERRVALERSVTDRLREAQGDWFSGLSRGIENFSDQAANVAGNVESVFTNAAQSMSQAWGQFVSTGKLDFGSLTRSVIANIAQMQFNAAASGLFKFLGAAIGSSFSPGWSATSTANPFSLASMNLLPSAQGNVFSNAPALSAYSNTIVSRPTLFPFAKGMGLMGEAGDEAIMPLKRAGDGSLGVRVMFGDVYQDGRDPGRMPRIIINNHGTPQQYQVDSLTRDEVVLITRDEIDRRTPHVIAAEAQNLDSKLGRSLRDRYILEPNR